MPENTKRFPDDAEYWDVVAYLDDYYWEQAFDGAQESNDDMAEMIKRRAFDETVKRGKMSVGWVYSGVCCSYCVDGSRWYRRGGHTKNGKSKTLRTHRTGKGGTNYRNRRLTLV